MNSRIIKIDELRQTILEVVQDLTSTVVSTFGPDGNNVLLYNRVTGKPYSTKDGVTVSNSLQYADPVKNMILSIIKESANNTNVLVGDGTTTSTLLICAALELMITKKITSKKDLEDFSDGIYRVIEYINDVTEMVDIDSEQIKKIVEISSNGDEKAIELITEAIQKIGKYGIIEVNANPKSDKTSIQITNGAYIDSRVVVSPKSMKDTDFRVLLVEGALDSVHLFVDLLKTLYDHGVSHLMIVAKEFHKDVIKSAEINNQRGVMNTVLVEAEGFSNSRLDILSDLALVLDCDIVSTDKSTSHSIRNVSISNLSSAHKLSLYQTGIIIVRKNDIENEEILLHIGQLREELEKATSTGQTALANIYRKRLYKFVSIATISVGSITEAGMNEQKDRIDDAVRAISSSVNGGVIYGGGYTLLHAYESVKSISNGNVNYLLKALCQTPLNILTMGSPLENIIEKMSSDDSLVYNVKTRLLVDVKKSGIYDPAKALTSSLYNMLDVVKTLINSSSMVVTTQGYDDV
jgi:chaperonin GroEL